MFPSLISDDFKVVFLFILDVFLDYLEGVFLLLSFILLTFLLVKIADSD